MIVESDRIGTEEQESVKDDWRRMETTHYRGYEQTRGRRAESREYLRVSSNYSRDAGSRVVVEGKCDLKTNAVELASTIYSPRSSPSTAASCRDGMDGEDERR